MPPLPQDDLMIVGAIHSALLLSAAAGLSACRQARPPQAPEGAPATTPSAATLLLVREGNNVQLASGVTAVLKMAADSRYDPLISDLGLPDGTGLS